jgi:hypothetical protein
VGEAIPKGHVLLVGVQYFSQDGVIACYKLGAIVEVDLEHVYLRVVSSQKAMATDY